MAFSYTLLQLLLVPFLFLPLIGISLFLPKYRMRTLYRLGFGLKLKEQKTGTKTVWIHALSVGEVTSALPLVSGIREEMIDVKIVFSTTTRSGAAIAKTLLGDKVDQFVPFPFDIFFITNRFIRIIQPDLFILVETDFWPGILSLLKRNNIPAILVNGRISEKSFQSYRRFSFFFKPIFENFKILSMQTRIDMEKMISLGIDTKKIRSLGNLKFDTALYSTSEKNQRLSFALPEYQQLIVAGSTHEGEEEIILKSFKKLKEEFPELYLIIAPRNVSRGKSIHAIAASFDLQANCRSSINAGGRDLYILDSIGELTLAYSHCHCAFVGGSLVESGGHNPIEPAIFGVPVLYGPHMEDFIEIAKQLESCGGGVRVHDHNELHSALQDFITHDINRKNAGLAAQNFIDSQQGVIKRHLQLINEVL